MNGWRRRRAYFKSNDDQDDYNTSQVPGQTARQGPPQGQNQAPLRRRSQGDRKVHQGTFIIVLERILQITVKVRVCLLMYVHISLYHYLLLFPNVCDDNSMILRRIDMLKIEGNILARFCQD